MLLALAAAVILFWIITGICAGVILLGVLMQWFTDDAPREK